MGTGRGGNQVWQVLGRFHGRQHTFWHELHQNKLGVLSSVMFHVTVIILAVVFVFQTVDFRQTRLPSYVGMFSDDLRLEDEPLKNLFEPENADILVQNVHVPDFSDQHDRAKGPIDVEPGVDWFGPGMTKHGKRGGLDGLGGDPGFIPGRIKPRVDGFDRRGLDLVFVFDSTGSMGPVISETRMRIRNLVRVLEALIPKDKIRIGVVTYRDSRKFDVGDWVYTVKAQGLTNDVERIHRFLTKVEAYGGGDIPEAVHEGLSTAILANNWRSKAVRIIVLSGDAPPHPEQEGIDKVTRLVEKWRRSGGIVSTIDTTGQGKVMPEFAEIARVGGGVSLFLSDDVGIVERLFVSIFPEEARNEAGSLWKRLAEGAELDGVRPSAGERPDTSPSPEVIRPVPLRRAL